MPATTSDIKSVHRQMRAWFNRTRSENGFRSPEIESAAHGVLWSLYEVGYNSPIREGSVRVLAEKVAELERVIR